MKPGNVLMTMEGVAKLTDFGLARARARAGEAPLRAPGGTPSIRRGPSGAASVLVSVGGMTPPYCSPEQAGRRPLTRKTDVWSWGASVLEMFAGGVFWQYGPAVEQSLESYLVDGSTEDGLRRRTFSGSAGLNRISAGRHYRNRRGARDVIVIRSVACLVRLRPFPAHPTVFRSSTTGKRPRSDMDRSREYLEEALREWTRQARQMRFSSRSGTQGAPSRHGGL